MRRSAAAIPTASGVAFQRGMFAELFRESGYEVCDLSELGSDCRDVHYTHADEPGAPACP
ncbi:MAG: hypothetical protein OXC08_14170 [Thiotrichales bacterium]|nr:hypothetical protein [Thiotrichales bacterium]